MREHGGLRVEIGQTAPVPLDLAFDCGPRDVLAIFGPSGSGKTTLLRCIAGLHRPPRSRIVCDGMVWNDTGAGRHEPTVRRRVGFVFQEYALFPHLTARGNVLAALTDRPAAERDAAAGRWLAATGLTELESRRPGELSGGQRQRVALARALARDPKVLLLDEPFAAIDRATRSTLQQELDELRHRVNVPVVLVTHDFEDVVRLATHVLLLDRGRAVGCGPLEALTSRSDLPWSRYGVGPGSVFDARVHRVDAGRGLAELSSGAGPLLVPAGDLAAGDPVRVRIPAREIILAARPPEGLSLHNTLAVDVNRTAAHGDQVLVELTAGQVRLLAEITRDAVDRLSIQEGRSLFALIKSVSLEVGRRATELPRP